MMLTFCGVVAVAGAWTWFNNPLVVAKASRLSGSPCFNGAGFAPAAPAAAAGAAAAATAAFGTIGFGASFGRGIIVLATASTFLSRLLILLSMSFVDFSKLSKTSKRLNTTSMISAGPPDFHGVSAPSSFLLTLHVYWPDVGSVTVEFFVDNLSFDASSCRSPFGGFL